MKIIRVLTVVLATVGLLALASPAQAQRRQGGNRPSAGQVHHGGNWHGNWRGGWHRGGHVNVYFGGFYPYGGYGYWGYPYGYWGYPYGYVAYPAAPYYSYDPQGVYQGRLANPPPRSSEDAKDVSMASRVQRQLAARGYYHGAIDGIVGEGTRSAIRRYQRANGLAVDGQIGDDLLESMGLG